MRRCEKCGMSATQTARYCSECGRKLRDRPPRSPVGSIGRGARPIGRAGAPVRRGEGPTMARYAIVMLLVAAAVLAAYSFREQIGSAARRVNDLRIVETSVSTPPATQPDPVRGPWREAARLAGDGNADGEPFALRGGPVRLRYAVSGLGLVTVWVLPAGDGIEDATGLPPILAQGEGEGVVGVAYPPGWYRLAARGGGATWQVIVEERR